MIVVDYDPTRPAEFTNLATRLHATLGDRALAIDHIGSTSVPGLPAKDCIDALVRVADLTPDLVDLIAAAGFRCRPEPWNRSEISDGQRCDKLVFAPPAGERPTNIHFRRADGPNARFALLFRDYLRAEPTAREAWGAFKQRWPNPSPASTTTARSKPPPRPSCSTPPTNGPPKPTRPCLRSAESRPVRCSNGLVRR